MHATIRTGDKLPDLLKIESELCSPVIHQLKVGIWEETRPISRFQRNSIGRQFGVMYRSMFKSVKPARQRMMLSSKRQQHHCIQSQSSQRCGIRLELTLLVHYQRHSVVIVSSLPW